MVGSDDDIPPPPQTQTQTQQTPHTVSTIKLLILKKGEYDIWAMKMEHYLAHTDYPIWEVIQRGNGHMCNKKNKVLFTDTECLVLSPDFKLPDENQVLLRVPRQNNMYSFNLENIVPSRGLACLIAKATIDKSNKQHKRKATQGLL
ncbi:hypothetical protein Tco_0355580 [Tanacetum coccineum]